MATVESEVPEVLQRIERSREFNRKCADLRILDREFYRAYRSCIRIPTDKVEAARNARWQTLSAGLQLISRMPAMRRAVRASLGLSS